MDEPFPVVFVGADVDVVFFAFVDGGAIILLFSDRCYFDKFIRRRMNRKLGTTRSSTVSSIRDHIEFDYLGEHSMRN